MVRPQGRSSFPPINSMAHDFPIPSASACTSPALQTVSPNSSVLSFGISPFVQPHIAPRITSDPKSRQRLLTQLLPDDTVLPSDDDQLHLHLQTSGLVPEDPSHLLNLADVGHQPKVPPHKPWNPIDASMNHRPDHNSLKLEPIKGHVAPDSGYAGSLNSRPFLHPHQSPLGSLEVSSAYTYDEPIPIGSAAQQTHYLPDQQRRYPPLTAINPTSPRPPSLAGAESITTPSGSQPTKCDECGESFNTKSEMTKHMARHSKKFICDHPNCPRGTDGFATKNDLDRHKASVHHDDAVPRKEYKCCVTNCKDPGKVWDRKDNFKAHVKRMHPEADVDEVVKKSFIGNHMVVGGAPSHAGSLPEPRSHYMAPQQFSCLEGMGSGVASDYNQTLDGQSPVPQYAYQSANPPYYASPTVGDMSQGVPADEEPYILSGHLDSHRPQVSQMNLDFSYTTPMLGLNPTPHLSATTRHTNYDSSATIQPPTSVQDQSRTTPRRPERHVGNSQMLTTQAILASGYHADESRGQQHPWSSHEDSASVVDLGLPPPNEIDPHLHIGSWDQASHSTNAPPMADVSDHSSQPGLNLAADEQPTASPHTGQRLIDVMQKVYAILDPLSPEEWRTAMEAVRNRRPGVSSEHRRVVQRAMEAFPSPTKLEHRPYKCSRSGCGKTFSANNIKTKHERRHDRLFFCTFDGCYSTFGTKDDLRRHEQRKHMKDTFEGFRCFEGDVQSSHHKLACSKFFTSRDEFEQHRRDEHRERAEKNHGGLKACKSCSIKQGAPGHFWCGFCNKVIQNKVDGADASLTEKHRLAHIDQHITKDKKTMEHWVDLKSGGKTKSQLRGGDTHQSTNEDSQDEDDSESFSPDASAAPVSHDQQALTNVHRSLVAPLPTGVKRKRSQTNVGDDASAPPRKTPRIDVYSPDGRNEVTVPTGSVLFRDANNRAPLQPEYLRCCECKAIRPINSGDLCLCYHSRCPLCSYIDVLGQTINGRTNTSNRRQSGG